MDTVFLKRPFEIRRLEAEGGAYYVSGSLLAVAEQSPRGDYDVLDVRAELGLCLKLPEKLAPEGIEKLVEECVMASPADYCDGWEKVCGKEASGW